MTNFLIWNRMTKSEEQWFPPEMQHFLLFYLLQSFKSIKFNALKFLNLIKVRQQFVINGANFDLKLSYSSRLRLDEYENFRGNIFELQHIAFNYHWITISIFLQMITRDAVTKHCNNLLWHRMVHLFEWRQMKILFIKWRYSLRNGSIKN